MYIGTIVGFLIGVSISYNVILPAGLWGLKLADITIGDILRIIGALVATGIVTGIGVVVDMVVQAWRDGSRKNK